MVTIFFFISMTFVSLTQAVSPKILSFTFLPSGKFQPRQNGRLQLVCRTSGAETIEFRKNGNVLDRTKDARVSVSRNSLYISNLDFRKDDANYQCVAKNGKGSVLSNVLRIKVSVLGDFLGSFKVNNNKILDVTVGRALLITCPSYSYTYPRNIIWGNVPSTGQPRVLSVSRRRYQLANGNLFFSVLQQADVDEINNQLGGISCFLYHNGPYKQSARYRLRVSGTFQTDFRTELTERLAATTFVKTGDEVSFHCAAAGSPLPTITWAKPDGSTISPSDASYVISPTGNKLTIRSAYKTYRGRYKCTASNRGRTQSSEGLLVVEDPPNWTTKLKDVTVNKNDNKTFTCRASGSGLISYTWFKNGRVINRNNNTYTVNGGQMTVKTIKRTDFGIIQCFARNKYGQIRTAAFLNVKGATIPPSKETSGSKIHFGYHVLIGGGVATIFGVSTAMIYLHSR